MEKKIRVLFNANNISYDLHKTSARSGIFFVTINILKEFAKNPDIELILYAKTSCLLTLKRYISKLPELKNVPLAKKITLENYFFGKIEELKFKCRKLDKKDNFFKKVGRFILNRLIRLYCEETYWKKHNIEYDVFFSPVEEIPKFFRKKNTQNYTIIYDAIPLILPEYNPASDKGSWFMKLVNSINKDDYYFAISKATKSDFVKYCPNIDPDKIYITPLACSENFKPNTSDINNIKLKYNIPTDKKYVFSLCTLEPRKNLIRTVKTFIEFIKKNNIDDLVFVLGGGHWEMFIKTLENEISNLGEYKDKIVRAGYIDDEDLAPLYSGAEWFVYTSMYEGFGLPPLEAMSCGCPIITSNNSSLPEVVGNAGIMIDYDSDEQHIEAYEKYYFNPELRKEYSQKGLERAKHFSWQKCADKMIEIIKQNC